MKNSVKPGNYIYSCLLALLIMLPATPIFADATKMRPRPPGATNLEMQAGIFTESHVVNNTPFVPTPHCSNGGTLVYGSLIQNPANPKAYTYECYVAFTYDDQLYNSNYLREINGWYTVASSSSGFVDQATLMYPGGFPQTSFTTSSCFSFGGGNYYSYKSVTLQVGSQSQNAATSGDTCSLTTTVLQAVQPYGIYTIKKDVWGQSWHDSCTALYVVQPTDIGTTINLDCCPTQSNYATPGPNVNFTVGQTTTKIGGLPCP